MTCKLVKHFMFLWQKPSQHCKVICLQLKNKVKKVWIKQGNFFKNWGSERLSNLSKVALQRPGLGNFTSSVSMLRVLYFLSEINPVCLQPWVFACLQSSFFSYEQELGFPFHLTTSIKNSTGWPSLFSKPKGKINHRIATENVVWFPGPVAASYGSKFCFYIVSGHCSLVYSVSQNWDLRLLSFLRLHILWLKKNFVSPVNSSFSFTVKR